MPVHRFQTEDGKIHRIEADTPEAAKAELDRVIGGGAASPKSSQVSLGGTLASTATGVAEGFAPLVDAFIDSGPLGMLKKGADAAGVMQGERPAVSRGVTPLATRVATGGHRPRNTTEEYARTIGQMAPNALAPGGMLARAANVLVPGVVSETAGQGARAMGAGETGEGIARLAGAVTGAGAASLRPRGPAPARAPQPPAMTLDDLTAANDRAWAKVDASGYRFPQSQVQTAADDVVRLVEEAGPELYPEAAKIARRVQELAKRGQLSPAQANRLRSQVGEKLMQPGSTEASVGSGIKSRIDDLIANDPDPTLATARDLHTRTLKAKEVSSRIDSAELAQETAGTGGNQNAVRQKLRPLIDPKSPQRIRNLTKDETAAIRRVTKGTPTQNMMRLMTAFDPTAGKLQAMLSTGGAAMTQGASLALMPVGMAAKAGESAIGRRNLQELMDLIIAGGLKPQAPAAPPPLRIAPNPYGGLALPGMAMAVTATPASAREKRRPKSR